MLVEVMLVVAIKNGQGHIDTYIKPMQSAKECAEEVLRYLDHEFPEYMDGDEVYARCTGKIPERVEVRGGPTYNPD